MPPPLHAAAAHGITYRPMSDADLPFVARLYASTRQDELRPTGWPQAAIDAFLSQQHEAQHSHYRLHYADMEWLIIEHEGIAIGRLYLADLPDEMRIIDIALVPQRRGSGLGGAILRDIQRLASERGTAVSIHVEKNNPARRLYDRVGFRLAEDQGVYDLCRWEPAASGENQKKIAS